MNQQSQSAKFYSNISSQVNHDWLADGYSRCKVCRTITQIAHLGWATSGPPAPVAATGGPPVAYPPHRWHAIWAAKHAKFSKNLISHVKISLSEPCEPRLAVQHYQADSQCTYKDEF